MMNRVKKRHIVLLSLLAVSIIASIFYLRNDQNGKSFIIRTYEEGKDFQAIVNLINLNKYWVAENPELFSGERMLLTRAPTSEPERKGTVLIDVAEVENQTAGFISYYRKAAEHGYIWVLAVDKNFRGRGIGEGLVSHALSELKKLGATYVTLGTRTVNIPALALYKKLGFVETSRDEKRGMVMLIKRNL